MGRTVAEPSARVRSWGRGVVIPSLLAKSITDPTPTFRTSRMVARLIDSARAFLMGTGPRKFLSKSFGLQTR
jgi:hypothetical protein